MKRERIMLVIISLVLICELFWRLLLPAQESTGTAVSAMGIIFDCGMILGLVGISFQILKSTARPIDAAGPWLVLPALGLLAGLGLFIIRLNGESRSELPPNPHVSVKPDSSVFPPDLERFGTRVGQVFTSYKTAKAEVEKTRWFRTDASERQKLPREALQECIARQRAKIEALDRVIELLSEPGFAANIDRMLKITEARGIDVGLGAGQRPDFNPDGWRLIRRSAAAVCQLNTVVEANWEEWRATTFPFDGEPKSWMREALAFQSEMETAEKERDELMAKRTNTPLAPTTSPTPDNQDR